MGRISVAAFKPKAGKEADVLKVIASRLPLLRKLKLATDREPILMRSRAGVIIQISEWVDDAAIERAHQTPDVLKMWDEFAACCDYVRLNTLAESDDDFATFEAI